MFPEMCRSDVQCEAALNRCKTTKTTKVME